MTNPKHTDTSRSGDLVERLRKEDEWTNQRPYFHAHAKSLEAATQLQTLAARVKVLEAENERLKVQAVRQMKWKTPAPHWRGRND